MTYNEIEIKLRELLPEGFTFRFYILPDNVCVCLGCMNEATGKAEYFYEICFQKGIYGRYLRRYSRDEERQGYIGYEKGSWVSGNFEDLIYVALTWAKLN